MTKYLVLLSGLVLTVLITTDVPVCAQFYPPPPGPQPSMSCTTRIVTGIDGRPRVCSLCITPSGPVEFCS